MRLSEDKVRLIAERLHDGRNRPRVRQIVPGVDDEIRLQRDEFA